MYPRRPYSIVFRTLISQTQTNTHTHTQARIQPNSYTQRLAVNDVAEAALRQTLHDDY